LSNLLGEIRETAHFFVDFLTEDPITGALISGPSPESSHRHVSHLWAVYSGSEITPEQTGLFAAARQSMRHRGDAANGWSMGWEINLRARVLDRDHAYLILKNLLCPVVAIATLGDGGMYPNLFDGAPPFQIDGNLGATAGIAEMLLQSHRDEIHLLPALPAAWPAGNVTSLWARGGFTVDMEWMNGRVTSYRIASSAEQRAKIRVNGSVVPV